MSIATYSFLPYLRQGIANSLQSSGEARATFSVKLDVHGDGKSSPVDEKKVQIYGPGDVIGIDPRVVVKTDPHNWITNFEPNYLAYIDFYDEDFPWRYTPVPAAGHRLNPWIALIVLKEDEFKEGQNLLNRPLPFFNLATDATLNFFPKKDQLWAWAHVHFNGDLTEADNIILTENAAEVDTALNKLQTFLSQNPDFAYSRLVCPRKLLPNTSYHAFVIPAYESGRLAGIGSDAAAITTAKLKIAWDDPNTEFPYYYRWKFNTGDVGDFEYLVRLLKPKVADSRVGRRVMDMTVPGANLKWVEDPNPNNFLGGILRLGGALKVPEESLTTEEIKKKKKFDDWAINNPADIHPFQQQVASFLNLADDYTLLPAETANANAKAATDLPIDPNEDEDPLITPPIYGRWHAMVERIYKDRNGVRIDNNYNWLNELNLDPRFRVPAHFGTRVVQENQEDFMEAAWEQIGEVLKANRQIRYGQFSILAGEALHAKHFVHANEVGPSKTFLLTAPIQKRIVVDGVTVFHQVKQSVAPEVIFSTPMRRIVRPRGRLAVNLEKQVPKGEVVQLQSVVEKINSGELLPAPPKTMPPALPSVDAVATQIQPSNVPPILEDWLRKYKWFPQVPLVLAVLVLLLLFLFSAPVALLILGIAIAGGLVFLWRKLVQWSKQFQLADSLKSENKTPQSVNVMPKTSDFKLTEPGEDFTPTINASADNVQAQQFKNSLKDMYRLFELTRADHPQKPAPLSLHLEHLSVSILDKIKPEKTVPAWTWQHVFFPEWIRAQLEDEGFVEAMAYPRINSPMYDPLKKISDELFLPNIELIEHNSITLLETNQKFIESYMVGLNHEFARELLWREYPTDQRGSYFRQFWDVSSVLKDPALKDKSEDEKREPYYDIPKLHEWRRNSKLGDHDNRQKPGDPPKDEVVLVIRGELLKKYPTAVVYAHKAEWTNNDPNIARSLQHAEEGDKDKPDPKYIRTPLYQAKVDPDIYFFGFDLTVKEVRGETHPETPTDENAGWFFVIKERPGEPRFGLDVTDPDDPNPELISWNDLNWKKVLTDDEGVIDVLKAPITLPMSAPSSDGSTEQEGQKEQYLDDVKVKWNNTVDAANLAYILYQIPMMVAVHASEMLLKQKT